MELQQTIAKSTNSTPLPSGLDSAALARLIEEVRNQPTNVDRAYDRVHNRHNR